MGDVRWYESDDFKEIQSWYDKRGIEFTDRDILPGAGFIIRGVCAGFIYMTDSAIAFIEGFITNPDASSEDRNKGLDTISVLLINHAKDIGARYIKCETKIKSIEDRAISMGFRSLGETVSLIREI